MTQRVKSHPPQPGHFGGQRNKSRWEILVPFRYPPVLDEKTSLQIMGWPSHSNFPFLTGSSVFWSRSIVRVPKSRLK